MGHGGTSFGFENGANTGDKAFLVEPTSYDYDGLISGLLPSTPLQYASFKNWFFFLESEAGDLTLKYFAMKTIIGRYLPLPHIRVDFEVPKGDYGTLKMKFVVDLFTFVEMLAEGR